MSEGSLVGTVVFDWDGTAVPDRSADAGDVRDRVERLCGLGADVVVITGTSVGDVKHVEIGLTDKRDAIGWVAEYLLERTVRRPF